MGLVDYNSDSDSESDSEPKTSTKSVPKPPQPPAKKQAFQKVVDRSKPGKILVSLPQTTNPSSVADGGDEPPPKRARAAGAGLFSGFNSFLPAPKNTGKTAVKPSAGAPPRPGINLKTSAAPGFSREVDSSSAYEFPTSSALEPEAASAGSDHLLNPRNQQPAPSIPEGQKPAEEVKLVGKPLKFRPLSVGAHAKKKPKPSTTRPETATAAVISETRCETTSSSQPSTADQPRKSLSLFSMNSEEGLDVGSAFASNSGSNSNGAYEPLFETSYEPDANAAYAAYADYTATQCTGQVGNSSSTGGTTESLDHIANDLNLSAVARRELFGRAGSNFTAKKVVNFNMDREYQHNEDIRAAGDQQIHNPVRALQGGKHSLKQLVQNAQNQREALEDSFAKGKSNRKEASSRYGW
ncbi:uncharacterized protein UV8b_06452 [Ustilaginoidea virens]|uniref:Stress activated map kinase interacting n=1 Tax=Ustilaginoidea virens TaxID=1159556 RepID=A0A063C6Q0_USTVR|nr:uncharacterized protein UV8b_06452 [Ustilaginoidea virens]QUC22211.1 hypothetical protein UV8b_06452 [Ustilaginoidea virens]GAO14055.1 hypothetical protein UVI_02038510 [Ustilaginoidea virens]